MFGGHRERIERLEAVVAVMASNQRQFAEALKVLVESANDNAQKSNANFDSILAAIRSLVAHVQRQQDDDADTEDDWWRQPHD
jgi:ABC-type transporter Mla subunit MlaD